MPFLNQFVRKLNQDVDLSLSSPWGRSTKALIAPMFSNPSVGEGTKLFICALGQPKQLARQQAVKHAQIFTWAVCPAGSNETTHKCKCQLVCK